MVAGHVTLDISCLDRLYLNGYVARLQTPGGVVWFFHEHRGKPIVSPALFEPIGEKFRAAMLFTVTGITSKTLRGLMTGLLHRPYSMNQASYDLSRLARNGLIRRVPG